MVLYYCITFFMMRSLVTYIDEEYRDKDQRPKTHRHKRYYTSKVQQHNGTPGSQLFGLTRNTWSHLKLPTHDGLLVTHVLLLVNFLFLSLSSPLATSSMGTLYQERYFLRVRERVDKPSSLPSLLTENKGDQLQRLTTCPVHLPIYLPTHLSSI
jgi:hypothetical protein